MLATSCVAQIAARARAHARHARMQAVGLLLLAAGLLALVLAFPTRSLLVLLAAGLLAGTGHGIAFLGAQAQLNLAAPPDRRGEVNAAFYTLIYLGVATAVISTGLLTLDFSLSTAVTAFARRDRQRSPLAHAPPGTSAPVRAGRRGRPGRRR